MRRGRLGFWFRLAAVVLEPLLLVLIRRDWRGGANIPRTGGAVLAVNHVSYADPLPFAHFVYASGGRIPRFIAKDSLFRLPLVGMVMRGAGQIPVVRDTADAQLAYAAAVEAVLRGETVCVYPEGTLTRDPELWPMTAKTGATRVALATGAPLIPIAQWGAQDILRPGEKRVRLWPRRTIVVVAGPPVDLAAHAGGADDPEVLAAATTEVMDAITLLLEAIRREKAPAVRHDRRVPRAPRHGGSR